MQKQYLNKFPDLPHFTSLVFSIDHWNMTALFVDNIQMVLTNKHSGKLEIILLQLKSYTAPFGNFHPSYLPNILCSFYWVSGIYKFDQ